MRICILGDSITWGEGDKEMGGWADRLKLYLMPKDFSVYNLGIRGDTSGGVLQRFKQEVKVRSRKLGGIIFAVGINDSQFDSDAPETRVDLETFKKNIKALIDQAKDFADTTVFIGLTRVDDMKDFSSWGASYKNSSIEKFDSELKNICTKEGILYISMKDVLNVADLVDGLHPNEVGYKKMFERIKTSIEPLLDKMTVDQ